MGPGAYPSGVSERPWGPLESICERGVSRSLQRVVSTFPQGWMRTSAGRSKGFLLLFYFPFQRLLAGEAGCALFTFMHWRRKWQPTSVFLPGESQGWGSLVGCRLWGRTQERDQEGDRQQTRAPAPYAEGRAACRACISVERSPGPLGESPCLF